MNHHSWTHTFRALRSRNYRLFFAGQCVSLTGSWLTRVAMSWLVYQLSHSALWLGAVTFAGQIPAFVIAPLAGVLADRWNKHRLLVITQVLLMVQAFALAFLVLTDQVTLWNLLGLSIFQGCVNAFDIPTRQAYVVEMLEHREDLSNAIALNSSIFNGARLFGPALAGFLIAGVGEGLCFLIDGLSYMAVIASLLIMTVAVKPARGGLPRPVLQELAEGFRYVAGCVPIRVILTLVATISLMGFSCLVLMPIYAETILKGGPETLGFLTAASGLGALCGALYLASRQTAAGLGLAIVRATAIGGMSLIFFSFSTNLWLSLFFLMTGGFGLMVQMASCNTVLQTIVDDDKRGRVMSFYSMAFLGMAPLGSMLISMLAHRFGAPVATMLGGFVCLAAALMFAAERPMLKKLVRPIYIKKGILPEIVSGIQAVDATRSASDQ